MGLSKAYQIIFMGVVRWKQRKKIRRISVSK